MDIRQKILDTLSGVEAEMRKLEKPEGAFVDLTDYAHLTVTAPDGARLSAGPFGQPVHPHPGSIGALLDRRHSDHPLPPHYPSG